MSNPDQLSFREGGRLATTLFGLPFLVGGVLLILSPWLGSGQGSPTPRFVFGGAVTLFGLLIACGRSGVVVDRTRSEVTCWWGLLVPMIRVTHEVQTFSYAGFGRQVIRSGNGTRTIYPVFLRPNVDGGQGAVDVHIERTKQGAQDQAERLASFLKLKGVVDATGSTPVVC